MPAARAAPCTSRCGNSAYPTTSALVGGSLPLATGAALACKRRGSGVAVAFFGDAGLEEGAFYEAMIVAAVWKVPILFVCENNSIPPEQRKRGQYTSSTLPAARLVDVPLALQVPAEAWTAQISTRWPQCFGRLVAEVRRRRWSPVRRGTLHPLAGQLHDLAGTAGRRMAGGMGIRREPDTAAMADWLRSDPLSLYLRTAGEGRCARPGEDRGH